MSLKSASVELFKMSINQHSVDTYGNMKMQLTRVVHHANQTPCRWRCRDCVCSVTGVDVQAGDAA